MSALTATGYLVSKPQANVGGKRYNFNKDGVCTNY